MPYKIRCWIPVDDDELETYRTRKEAKEDMDELRFLQPENIYRIVKVEEGDAK
jgi:hypothetical protein